MLQKLQPIIANCENPAPTEKVPKRVALCSLKSPFHRDLLLEILRFLRMLIENSGNRFAFNMSEVLYLLATTYNCSYSAHFLNWTIMR